MVVSVGTSGKHVPPPAGYFHSHRKLVIGGAIALAVIAGFLIVLHSPIWPFERAKVLKQLSEASDSAVSARGFRQTYFPSPGCILEAVEFRHGNGNPPLITMEKLIVKGSYTGMLRHHLDRITAVGMHVLIPPVGTGVHFHSQNSNIVVDEFIADGSSIQIAEREKHPHPLIFTIHKGALRDLASDRAMRFAVSVHMPEPPAEVETTGQFGPWKPGAKETPLSGEYTLRNADLGHYVTIGGMLSSRGRFYGSLQHINISGETDVPDFEVKSSGHKVRLQTVFDAYVDGSNGDTFLKHVDAHFGHTQLTARGSIAKEPGSKGKVTKVELVAPHGRIEDVLGLFVSKNPPMAGETAMRADVEIPPGPEEFLKRLKLEGRFGIEEGKFSKSETQTDVDKLSAGARGENKDDAPNVATDLSGQVSLAGGVATFSELSFAVPGVKARLQGTYNIINYRINLHGPMRVDTKISKTTTGMKSFLLKVIDPIFKKRHKGEVVPVRISGTYEHPQFGLDLGEKDAQHASGPRTKSSDKAR
jgi:AsmA-like C-terminal region